MKARQVYAKDAIRHDHAPRAEHLFVVDDRGRVWERFSDDEAGRWSEIPLPERTQKVNRKPRKL